MNDTIRGAAKSKTIWLNVALAAIGGLELAGSNLTILLGPRPAAALVTLGAIVNICVRFYTTQALADKA